MDQLLTGLHNDFILDKDMTYLNCANMSPVLISVREAGLQALETRAAPWKLTAKDWFTDAEELRRQAGRIFETNEDNIALIPAASYGLAVAAGNLQPERGKTIIVLEDQFPSNFYVWDELARRQGLTLITVPKAGPSLTENILRYIDARTGIIALPNCHWMDGTLIDLEKISAAAKSVKAFLVLDLSQSLGALPLNIERIDPDFAVAVGYKWLLGPYGLGYMYVSPRWHEEGKPLEYSWLARQGSDDFTTLTNYTTEYRRGARKFDMGEFAQFHLVPMAIAALKQILDWKVARIQASLKTLTDMLMAYKQAQGLESPVAQAGHMIGIPLGNRDTAALKERLSGKKIVVSFRGASIRVSPHVYNSASEVEALLSALNA